MRVSESKTAKRTKEMNKDVVPLRFVQTERNFNSAQLYLMLNQQFQCMQTDVNSLLVSGIEVKCVHVG